MTKTDHRTKTLAGLAAALVASLVLVVAAALATTPAASAASGNGASFAVRCDFSHRAAVDPIVYPYPPGNPPDNQDDSHSHDFLGNKTTQYNSTYDGSEAGSVSMINQPTTCSRPEDTAGYWIPTVSWQDQQGTDVLTSNRAVFYYRAGGKDHTMVKPFDKNLKVITGRVRWYCGTDDGKEGSQDPPKQCKSGVLGVRVVFPDCSNGQIDSADHRSHMARSVLQNDGTRLCPDTHPIPVPTLTVNANFPIPKTSGTVTLSSGDASTMHADFWNTWDQDAPFNGLSGGLSALVKHCINEVPPSEPRPEECRAPTATA